jgi:hypothetical protein
MGHSPPNPRDFSLNGMPAGSGLKAVESMQLFAPVYVPPPALGLLPFRALSSPAAYQSQTFPKFNSILYLNPVRLTFIPVRSQGRARITKINLSTAKTYHIQPSLRDVCSIDYCVRTHRKLQAWIRWKKMASNGSYLRPMQRKTKTIAHHLSGILAHWKHNVTNAFMKSRMSAFSATKRKPGVAPFCIP